MIRIGPVQVGTHRDGRGRTKHTAVCTAPGCDFSADYNTRASAELAARTHRCNPR
ncbi:mobile element transfer protein [Streptomyces sp. NPDC004520]|uniref:mobile element transfer protein n=1 Tax=Streptomyces sp. NPDC004520 TaxID=3364702 RepID=UPI0036BFE484